MFAGGTYRLDWATMDGGGRSCVATIGSPDMVTCIEGGNYELSGTIGQPDPGCHVGDNPQIGSGFWAVLSCESFGDIVPTCIIDVDDLLCVLDDFTDPAACVFDADIYGAGECPPNGIIDVDDILAVLDAFEGRYRCPHPCSP